MTIDAANLKKLIENERARVTDTRVTTQIRGFFVEPTPILRNWNYGAKGQKHLCWNVLEHGPEDTAIIYSENGFGPKAPWGLVALQGMSMGTGSFPTFMQAYFESFVATLLPIWRVFKTDPSGVRGPITPEGGWDETWKQVMRYREQDSASRYDCDSSIRFGRE
jgi:hypothetical protein